MEVWVDNGGMGREGHACACTWKADLSASIATETGCLATAVSKAFSSPVGTSVKPVRVATAAFSLSALHRPRMPVPLMYGYAASAARPCFRYKMEIKCRKNI